MKSHAIASAADVRTLERLPYARFMAHSSVLAALEHSAALHGERPALTALDSAAPGAPLRRWTHAQCAAEVRRAARLFARLAGKDTPRVALLATVPTLIAALLSLPLQRAQLASVRALLTGGSPLPDELAAAFEQRHGIPVRNILGMTECAGVIAIEPLAAPRTPGSCGLALPYTEVQAQRPDGSEAPPGESGILRVRGPNVGPGYTDAARNPGTFEDGWLISGSAMSIPRAESS